MQEKQEHEKNAPPVISPLAKDTTYGERVHHAIFAVGINFIANLLLSAGFSYWVNHSQTPIKLFGKQFGRPSEIQTTVAQWIEKKPFMGIFKGDSRMETAKVMSGVLTLTAAGHVVMIPSVWVAAKIKAPMVAWLNRRHYGDAAMEDPTLQARQHAIETEDRPTLFGAVIGRMGTLLATQFAGYTIGSQTNAIKWASNKAGFKPLQEFKGIDYTTEFAGDKFGGIISESLPVMSGRMNRFMARKNFGWSARQMEANPQLSSSPYGTLPGGAAEGFNEHFGKYVVSDILYSGITAVTIGPVINLLKKYIPGVTYKPKPRTDLEPAIAAGSDDIQVRANPLTNTLPLTDTQDEKSADAATKPNPVVSAVDHQNRLRAHGEALVSGVGA